MERYSWVTDEMFTRKLGELLDEKSGEQILAIPGVYEVVSEELNNEVLDELSKEREEMVDYY